MSLRGAGSHNCFAALFPVLLYTRPLQWPSAATRGVSDFAHHDIWCQPGRSCGRAANANFELVCLRLWASQLDKQRSFPLHVLRLVYVLCAMDKLGSQHRPGH